MNAIGRGQKRPTEDAAFGGANIISSEGDAGDRVAKAVRVMAKIKNLCRTRAEVVAALVERGVEPQLARILSDGV